MKPDTVHDAVTKTGAKYAFIYLAHGSSDHMRSTIEALKSAGIEQVVFLSSFTVHDELKAITPDDGLIPFIHAQVEINLGEVFGANSYVAARPGSFASNEYMYKAGLEAGTVKIFNPDATVDCIVPEDIGRFCGTVLAKGPPQDGERHVYLYGPQLLRLEDVVRTIAKVLGKDPQIVPVDEQDAAKLYEERGFPPAIANSFATQLAKKVPAPSVFGTPIKEEEMSNVEKYTGNKATTFEQWVEKNKQMFVS